MKLIKSITFIAILFLHQQLLTAQGFVSDPNIEDPVISFLNDSVVVMQYESIYDVHEDWDTIQYPGAILRSGLLGKFDYPRIFDDLMTVLDAREYHFIPLYTDDDYRYGEVPGWISAGSYNESPAKNIGHNNNIYDTSPFFPERGNNMRMPHMNNVEFLDRDGYGVRNFASTLTLMHEIGHHWGVKWVTSIAYQLGWSDLNWEPWMPAIMLVNDGGHWWPELSSRWVNLINAGILASAPERTRYNLFDLYAMGILPYNEIQDSVIYVRDTNTSIEYPVTVDSLINVLAIYQDYQDTNGLADVYFTGDGRRIPETDSRMNDLRTLIVVVIGQVESDFDITDQGLVMKLARDLPVDWDIATRNRSHMSVEIDHRIVNNFTKEHSNLNNVQITANDFITAYDHHQGYAPDTIRIESLPEFGSLYFNGMTVSVGQEIALSALNVEDLIFQFSPGYEEDFFYWNANPDNDSRYAAKARVKIKPLVDAELIDIILFDTVYSGVPHNIEVSVNSLGEVPLTTMTIEWAVNDTLQTPYTWSGNIPLGSSETFVIGTAVFPFGLNNISASIIEVNGYDSNLGNNDQVLVVTVEPIVDAELSDIIIFDTVYSGVPHNIEVSVNNSGEVPLTTMTIEWAVNDTLQAPYTWSGNIPAGSSETFVIGTAVFPIGLNNISASIIEVNGYSDYNLANNDQVLEIESNTLVTTIESTEINNTSLNLYPNPVSDFLNLTVSEPGEYTIRELSGKVLQQQKFSKGALEVNVKTLLPGMYIIIIKEGERLYTQKFIKE